MTISDKVNGWPWKCREGRDVNIGLIDHNLAKREDRPSDKSREIRKFLTESESGHIAVISWFSKRTGDTQTRYLTGPPLSEPGMSSI